MKVKLHPAFIVYLIFLMFYGQIVPIFFYLISVTIHEFSHSVIARKLGYKLDKMTIMPYGVCLNYETSMFSPYDEILIAISGPLSNFIVCILLLALWWLFPLIYPQTQVFFMCNLVLFVYNLLPCYPLDGGRILCAYLSTKFKKITVKNSRKEIKIDSNENALRAVKLSLEVMSCYYSVLLKGDIESDLGMNSEAEASYHLASRMCPCRFLPLYRLYYLYQKSGRDEEMQSVGSEILSKPMKIPSANVRRIRLNVRQDMARLGNSQ